MGGNDVELWNWTVFAGMVELSGKREVEGEIKVYMMWRLRRKDDVVPRDARES